MYDSGLTRWNAKLMGPKRDVIGELARSVRDRGMIFGVSSHRAEHWWYMSGGREIESDVNDPAFDDFYGPAQPQSITPTKAFKDDLLARCCELVDKYRPQLFYFDTWIERPPLAPYRKHFAAYYYNRAAAWGQGVAINYKNDAFAPRSAVLDVERGQLGDTGAMFWQTDTAVGKKSWGYVRDEEYKSAESIVGDLVDIVSKNGTLLLNIGPKPDGIIPDQDRQILLEIGRWLNVNGEAIYATRPWTVYGEGPTAVPEGHFTDMQREAFTTEDFRFTTRGRSTLYAICLGRPRPTQQLLVRSLGSNLRLLPHPIVSVQLLGSDRPTQYSLDPGGLKVTLPASLPTPYGCALKITW